MGNSKKIMKKVEKSLLYFCRKNKLWFVHILQKYLALLTSTKWQYWKKWVNLIYLNYKNEFWLKFVCIMHKNSCLSLRWYVFGVNLIYCKEVFFLSISKNDDFFKKIIFLCLYFSGLRKKFYYIICLTFFAFCDNIST